jgi:hypothetical protein
MRRALATISSEKDIGVQSSVNRYEPRQERSAETSFTQAIRSTSAEVDAPEEVGYFFILSRGQPTMPFAGTTWGGERDGDADSVGAVDSEPVALPVRLGRVPSPPLPQHRFMVLQKWEGTVSTVGGDEFVAVIRDLTDRSRPDEEAAFPIEEVPEADRNLMAPGAVFYWNVGYELTAFGQRKRVSAIRFRRLPAWTRSEIESVQRRANEFKAVFGLDGQSQALP